MRRKVILADLALVALAVAAGWRLRENWREARHRERTILGQAIKPAPAPLMAPVPRVEQVTAASYNEVAQKMLFAPDRNPTVVIETPKPKPMPALPVAHGVLNFGDGPMVILSERSGASQRAFRPGDKIGDFKLTAVSPEEIAFEWEGKEVKRRVDELREKKTAEAAAAGVPAYERPGALPPAPSAVSSTSLKGPGVDVGGGLRGCVAGDASPAGTVVEGLRKVVTATPFGKGCHWEPVK